MADKNSKGYKEALRLIEENFRTKETCLDLSNLELKKLPPEIGQLTHLYELILFNNKLITLPKEINQLINLEILNIGLNELNELPKEIGQLSNLKALYILDNKLTALPKEIRQLSNLRALLLEHNQLNIPPEIIEKRLKPQIIFNYYFENVVRKDRPLNEVKMLLLGEGGVGKTSLVNCLVKDRFVTTSKTEGIEIHNWYVEVKKDCNVQINLWDFAGQEIAHSTHQFFLTKRSLYLLVLDSRGSERGNRLEEWLKVIQNFANESPIIIVCNKSDEHRMELDERTLREKYPNIREIIKVSCKKDTNIKTLKQKILKEIRQMPHVFDPFSKKWFAVKQRLENLRENYISFEDYLKICDEEGVTGDIERETLIKFLHDLGIVMNFRDDRRLNDTNVLNPQWITEGIYKILTAKILDDAHGVLTLEMVGKILNNHRYPKHKHRFIVQMMQKFERCFPLKKDETFLVPDLLPKQQPDLGDWNPEKTGLGFQYRYEIEPGSFITRFIVSMNEYIDEELYWRKGVVLTNRNNTRALIKTDLEDKIIFIWIDGEIEGRRSFLSVIRSQFEKIHQAIPSLKVTEYIQNENILIPYQSLLKLEENNILVYYLPEINREINVEGFLNILEDEASRRLRQLSKKDAISKQEKTPSEKLVPEALTLNQNEMNKSQKLYDVALSFAGENRPFVKEVYEELKKQGIKVFYDYDDEISDNLWGKELMTALDEIYRKSSKYVVVFISTHYAKKEWTKHELKSALAKVFEGKNECVLPARFDDTDLPGLQPTIRFVDLRKETPQSFAQKILKKLGKL